MNRYACGQRWVSLAEPTLGLGLVLQVDLRQVQVLFPAEGETRIYAIDSAPLKRMRVSVGDSVSDQSGNIFTVESVEEKNGLLHYAGQGCHISESALADNICGGGPEKRILAGHVDSSALFDLRLETLNCCHTSRMSPIRGYTGARIELLPHQLYIAREVSQRQFPRVLLSDEVGLGKTIEACLILHRMIVCGNAKRVLILLPDALLHQWFVELIRRFNLAFRIVDQQFCLNADKSPDDNPFAEEQFVLCGIDFLVENPLMVKNALEMNWDVVVVDEAHHLSYNELNPSIEYKIVESFAKVVSGLLLLTASPEQTGLESHFARLRLLDPHRYSSFKKFKAEHDHYATVAKDAKLLIKNGAEHELQAMLDRYGPGRVVFRNSRKSMSGFPKRVPHLIKLEKSNKTEFEIRSLWLAGFLEKHRQEKVLVICATAKDVIQLESFLRSKMGIDIASFHENLTLLQCDRQAAWFAEPNGTSVLITSGMGGEGRNYQFASQMVLMDVSEDPELVEQRIGRLDRIGQQRDIHIHIPYVAESDLADRVRWLNEGLNAFAAPLVGGYQMYLKFKDKLNHIDDALIDQIQKEHNKLSKQIESGRNLLLEMSSCRPKVANEIIASINEEESSPKLEAYMVKVFDQFGVDAEPIGGRDYLLSADLLFCEEFPLPRERGAMHITYDRKHALSRPSLTLLSWDHPMVQGAIDLILGSERGSCSLAHSSDYEEVMLQAVYVLEVVSTDRLKIERYLPPTPIIIQVNETLKQISDTINIDGDCESWKLLDNVELKRDRLPTMISESQKIAEKNATDIRKKSTDSMTQHLQAEVLRMHNLKKINTHIDQKEIDAANNQIKDYGIAIKKSRLRLDAIRLIF